MPVGIVKLPNTIRSLVSPVESVTADMLEFVKSRFLPSINTSAVIVPVPEEAFTKTES
jgi:hypothetical protein